MLPHGENLIDGHFLGGPCDQATPKDVVCSPYDGRVVGTVATSTYQDGLAAVAAAHRAFSAWRTSPRRERQALLRRIAYQVRDRRAELAALLVAEIGKPVVWAEGEVDRLALTFDLAGDLVATYGHEALPTDLDPRGDAYRLTVERFPLGVVLAIVPYNWPFNLAAHKIAPALATGNTVVVKPAGRSALCTLALVRLIHEAGCPPGVVNAVNLPGPEAGRLAEHPDVAVVSFTGSPAVGWGLKDRLPRKRVSLELGADSSAILHNDADLEWAIPRIVAGGFGYAGQVCIAVQHVWAHADHYQETRDRLIAATLACPTGDPDDRTTVCGPLIDNDNADRVMAWIEEARSQGAEVLAGARRQGNLVWPTLVENPPYDSRLACAEVFGPVVTLRRYSTLDEVVAAVNASAYGIHAGIFTRDLAVAHRAFSELEVGGVVVNDFPTLRFDNMPYGGVKQSGFGREGIRYAMDELTEQKALLTRVT